MWCTLTKQGTSRTGQAILRYGQIVFGIGVENDSSVDFVDFEIFVFLRTLICLYHLHVISDWFSNIFQKKKKKKSAFSMAYRSNPKL